MHQKTIEQNRAIMKKLALGIIIVAYSLNALLAWIAIGSESTESNNEGATIVITLLFAAAIVWAYWYLYSYSDRDRWIPVVATVAMAIAVLATLASVNDEPTTTTTGVGTAIFGTIVAAAAIAGALRLYTNRRYSYWR